jgi:hypothetical protein
MKGPAIAGGALCVSGQETYFAPNQSEMRKVINATTRGEEFIDKSCEIALEALVEIQDLIPKNGTEPSNGMSCS